jgi:hypothetical protein
MREPKLGDVVVRKDGKSGRIETVTDYEGVTVVGVKYPNSRLREFYSAKNSNRNWVELAWDGDHWVVK